MRSMLDHVSASLRAFGNPMLTRPGLLLGRQTSTPNVTHWLDDPP
jgi:hypothetical protein